MQRLHEAEILVEHGETAEAYVRSQVMTKAFEAIGLASLSIWEREVTEDGTVIDFDGRPMHEKTTAALHPALAPFEYHRREIEHNLQVNHLDRMLPGEVNAEDSQHPSVSDELAAAHGYHPEFRWFMKRLYERRESSLVLYSYSIKKGLGDEGIIQYPVAPGTTIEDLLAAYDTHAEKLTGIAHFLGEIWTGGERDYGVIRDRREALEAEARPYVDQFVDIIREVGWQRKLETLDEQAAGDLLDEYERGFFTLMLVKFNPERASLLIDDEDLAWAESLLEFSLEETLLAAADISNRNQIDWIACGGLLAAILGDSETAKDMKCVTCPGCKKLVDAITTPTKITCPSCKLEVAR